MLQASTVVTIGLQHLLGARLVGADAYGQTAVLLAIPSLYLCVVEPALTATAIRSVIHSHDKPAGCPLHVFGLALAGLVPAIGIVMAVARFRLGMEERELLAAGVLLTALAAAMLAGAALTAYGFAVGAMRALVASRLVSITVQLVSLIALSDAGAHGYLLSMLCTTASLLLVLACNSSIRHGVAQALGSMSQLRGQHWPRYLAMMLPNLMAAVLSNATILMAGLLWPASHVAQLKITLTLVGCTAHLLPLPPALLQVLTSRTAGQQAWGRKAIALQFGSILFISAGLFCVREPLTLLVFGGSVNSNTTGTILMFATAPFFASLQSIGAVVLAIGQERSLIYSTAAGAAGYLLGAVSGGLESAFAAASIVFVAASVYVCRAGLRRAIGSEGAAQS